MKPGLSIRPDEAAVKLLKVLPKRTKDVLEQRFGLTKSSGRMTLDAIGKKYGITRERVRQIESDGFSRIKKSSVYAELSGVFAYVEDYLKNQGQVMHEDKLLASLALNPKAENSVYFLLRLHPPLKRLIEDDNFHTRWVYGADSDAAARKSVGQVVNNLKETGKPVLKGDLLRMLRNAAGSVSNAELSDGALENWLGVSKLISKNHFDEWGLVDFPEIKPRGVRDLSHMVMTKSGSPMHFSEVAESIGRLIGKGVHVQTVHNELIKDERFVLVGRGLYALKYWGYDTGTVKDVIKKILEKSGPLSREGVIDLVAKQRFVKPNTIIINLENKKFFKKLQDGRYAIR